MVDGGGEEVGGFEDFKVALRAPTAAGAVDDGLGLGVPVDFLEGEWGAQEIFREALAAFGVARRDGFFPAVDVEAAVFPREEIGDFVGTEVFAVAEDLEEAVAEEFGDGGETFLGHGVEPSFFVEQAVGGEDVEMRMEDEVIAEGVDGGGGGDATARQAESGAEGVAQAFGGGLEKEVEEVPAFAEDAAEHFREGEDELPVRDFVADGGGNPTAGLADAALVAGGAEVAGLAGEGEELFVAAIGTMEAGEAGGEIAAPKEGADGGDGIGAQWSHGAAVVLFVACDEIVPGVADELPEGRGARAARAVDGGHECPWKHASGQRQRNTSIMDEQICLVAASSRTCTRQDGHARRHVLGEILPRPIRHNIVVQRIDRRERLLRGLGVRHFHAKTLFEADDEFEGVAAQKPPGVEP